jgi:hypothetical protein
VRYAIAVAIAFLFGAADQYLGGLWSLTHVGWWAVSVSAMSAPWLALPFVFGTRENDARRSAWVGLAVTMAAVLGYFVMTLSPIEGVSLDHVDVIAFARSQVHVYGPALVSGPVFGWLGYRWRTDRWWVAAAFVVGAFCLESVARQAVGLSLTSPGVRLAELAIGIAIAVYFTVVAVRHRPV